MDAVGAQLEVAQVSLAQRNERLRGAGMLKLIEGAASAGAAQAPPARPVSVTPRAGSTIEVVA